MNNVDLFTAVEFGPGKGFKAVIALLVVLSIGLITLHISGVRPEAVVDGIRKIAKPVAPAPIEKASVEAASVVTVKEDKREGSNYGGVADKKISESER